jgi:Ca2+-binding EF-hand superfamily protein
MKKPCLTFALASATLFLAATRAEEPKPAASPAPAPALDASQAALLKRYDLNHDGKLDENELAAAHEAMLKNNQAGSVDGERGRKIRAALLKQFDKNGDGQLDENERAEMRKFFLARYDKNGDGRLDDEERAAMRADFKARAQAKKQVN